VEIALFGERDRQRAADVRKAAGLRERVDFRRDEKDTGAIGDRAGGHWLHREAAPTGVRASTRRPRLGLRCSMKKFVFFWIEGRRELGGTGKGPGALVWGMNLPLCARSWQ